MKRALLIIAATLTTAFAEPGDMIRWVRWRVETVYSRSETNVPMDATMSARVITHSFAVIQKEGSEHPAIKQITVDSMGSDQEKWEQQTRKFERLGQGNQVVITVSGSAASFKKTEASKLGELLVNPDQIEIDTQKTLAN
jgi:ABC-type molybdate transport system substrate-binding protein